ncbi:uncharacterized protein N7496_005356 [Penicillium cataractarum]|uniref:Uncharacterized protein n=1 Tax=Penicillium cataractarum TaxID=2100454 RepID=A0A9W9SG05_9EURO|nr:uncharacterized protein N7496_005356 [Penicillium cataractarum]KAJ5377947.1 hypothetical protein N7496_005356 [Penicillium cataractarum]
MFLKPTTGFKRILFLLMVPAAILVVRYRMHNLATVTDQTLWRSKTAGLQQEDAQENDITSDGNTSPYKISLSSLNGDASAEDSSQSDRTASGSLQRYFIPHENAEDVSIVAARSGPESTDWIEEFCEDYKCTSYIYSLDAQPDSEFLVPYSRKGHEASAYLSYIIDHYDNLAPYTIFIHGREEQWHNDVAGPNTPNVLANLRYQAVSINGYVNLRCTNRPGCPSTIFQAHPVAIDFDYQYMINQLPEVLGYLLGIDPSEVPTDIGHQCCAQFAVTRERIQERPQSDYIRILEWIATTDMTDNYGIGWLIEKLWHIIFGMPAVYCATEEQCRCDLYGWCGPNPSTNNQVLTPIS